MPFTLAHPAVVIPLYRLAPRWLVLSALVAGSMAPDFHYFLPFDIDRNDSHNAASLIWFSLPVAMMLYVVFHLLLKAPLTALLPDAIRMRLPVERRQVPRATGIAVIASILLGALTHLAWDDITHSNGFAIRMLPILGASLFAIGDYHITLFRLLQFASSVLGLCYLYWCCYAWLRAAPLRAQTGPADFSARQRWCILTLLTMVPVAIGLLITASDAAQAYIPYPFRQFVHESVVNTLCIFELLLLTYGVLWHVGRRPQKAKS